LQNLLYLSFWLCISRVSIRGLINTYGSCLAENPFQFTNNSNMFTLIYKPKKTVTLSPADEDWYHIDKNTLNESSSRVLQVVAIKHLTKSNTSSSDSFTREYAGVYRLHHPNLVCLSGCCMEVGGRYLVYEYEFCDDGNLAQNLLSNVLYSSLFLINHSLYSNVLIR